VREQVYEDAKMVVSFIFIHPHWLQAIRKNGFNPIGSVKAGFILLKISHLTIDLTFVGISKILAEKPPIRPVKKDEKGESKPV